MTMRALPPDSGLCSNSFSNLNSGLESEFGLNVLSALSVTVFTDNYGNACIMKCIYANVMTDFLYDVC